jgi:hypothetical protein
MTKRLAVVAAFLAVAALACRAGDFATACRREGAKLSIVLRDRDVSAPGGAHYVFRTC